MNTAPTPDARVRLYHVPLAIALYLACLFFPALYVNDNLEPQWPLGLLISGWGGVFDLNFGWYANPAFALAVLLAGTRPRRSAMLACLALLLALTLPFYGYVRVHELASRSLISAYGWGYALWVAAMAVLCGGQLRVRHGAGAALRAGLLAGGIVVAAFLVYLVLTGLPLTGAPR